MQFPRFPGMVKHRTAAEVGLFVQTIQNAGLDPVAVATVIESESARTWSPSVHGPKVFTDAPGYPIGLIQFAPSTAKMLGTTTADLERMSFAQQLQFVVKYFNHWGGGKRLKRLADYYAAGLGSGVGTDDSHVIFKEGSPQYDANKALDKDHNGTITTGDLSAWMNGLLSQAKANGYMPVVVAGAAGLEWLLWLGVGWFIVRRRKARAA